MCGNPFKKPKIPVATAANAVPATPEVARSPDDGQQAQRLDDRRRALYAAGRAGTQLTGPLGLTSAPKIAFASLLGGGFG